MDPISSTSTLCRRKAFKVTSALLTIPSLRTFTHSFTAPNPPVTEWIRWHRSYIAGHIYFHYDQEFQWKHFAESKVVTFLQLLTLCIFFASSNLISLPEAILTQLQSWTAPPGQGPKLASRRVSGPVLCPWTTYHLFLWKRRSCHFSCSINCTLVKERGTAAVSGWWGRKNISFPSLCIKLSWIVIGNQHSGEIVAGICLSPQSNQNSNLHHTAPEVPEYKAAKVFQSLTGSLHASERPASSHTSFSAPHYLG